MRFGLLTQWYDPEPGPAALPGILARGLAARGHEVSVLTGFPNYPTGQLAPGYEKMQRVVEEQHGDVRVRRVALYPGHSASVTGRLLNYGSFGISALASGMEALRGCDAIWVNYSPITIALPMWAARYGLRVPQVIHVLDLWPDTILVSGLGDGRLSGPLPRAILDRWCAGMYAAASSVAYIAPSVGRTLLERGVPPEKLSYVPMWADEAVFHQSSVDLRPALRIPMDRVVLLYAGAMGEPQGLDTLIEACRLVRDPRFLCLLAGSGTREGQLRAASADLENVRFLGRVGQSEMTALMATADLCYIGLTPHGHSLMTMPSKTQATLAAGRPLLVAARGDVRDVVTESGAGLFAEPGDARSVAQAIEDALRLGRGGLEYLGSVGRSYYEKTFSVETGVSNVEALLIEAANARREKDQS